MPKLMYNGEELLGGGAFTGVSSFNGRVGEVMPQEGDYTAEMVGAATMDQVYEAIHNILGEFKWSPKMTSKSTPSPYSVSSAGNFNGEVSEWRAFDGSADTAWAARPIQNWIMFDAGALMSVYGISLLPRSIELNLANQFIKTGTVEGSIDGETWVTLASINTGTTAPTTQEWFDVHFQSKVTYRYYRISDIVSWDTTYHYIGIAEIRFIK